MPLWVFGIGVLIFYSPLAWVRRLEFFAKAFIFAVIMIVLGVTTTSYFARQVIFEQGGEPGLGYEAVNTD